MANEVISYFEMCQREGGSLQKGMNYRRGVNYSVILMSTRSNAPYRDRLEGDGAILIYEGHDHPKVADFSNPKTIDQPEITATGKLTENGKFHKAAAEFKMGLREAEKVKVYEKIRDGIWSNNGLFELIDSWRERDGNRLVFKFNGFFFISPGFQPWAGSPLPPSRMFVLGRVLSHLARPAPFCLLHVPHTLRPEFHSCLSVPVRAQRRCAPTPIRRRPR